MAENIESSPPNEAEDNNKRRQMNDVIRTLHTLYKAMAMPSRDRLLHQKIDGLAIQPALNVDDPYKLASTALDMKKDGDMHFCKGEYRSAIFAYTQCLAYAEEDSETTGHAYANRSACLLKQGKYEQSLSDIERALNSNYPEDKKEKLRERFEWCLPLHNEMNPSTSDEADGTSSEPPRRNDMKAKIDREWCELSKNLNKNPLLPNTSTKVELKCNETWGRHMVATQNIRTGEILSTEKYFTMMIDRSYCVYHLCSYCLTNYEALIPCPSCSDVMYCSDHCLIKAFNSYHRLECQIYRSKKELRNLNRHERMSLRLLLVGTNQGADLSTLVEKLTVMDIFAEKVDPTNKPLLMDYLSTLQLCRTFERPLLNARTKPVHIIKMIIALQDVGFFDSDPNQQNLDQYKKRLNKMELFAALFMFNHTVSLGLNTFSVEQISTAKSSKQTVGMGVHILHNMVNHSCCPNVEYFTRDGEHVYYTLRPIAKGEQIFATYSDTFDVFPKESRHAILSDPETVGGFTCECEACVNDWPTHETLKMMKPIFLTKNVKNVVKEVNKLLIPVVRSDMSTFSRVQIFELICRLRRLLHTNVKCPCYAISYCEFVLQMFMKFFYDTTTPSFTSDTEMKQGLENWILKISSYFIKYE